jgi:uncharacterized phage protein gp47/JayE
LPFLRPTFSQIKQRIAAEILASVPNSDGLLRYTNLGVIGLVQAAAEQGLYGYLDYIARQAVPYTAEDEFLEAWGALKGIVRLAATTAGTGQASPGQAVFAANADAAVPDGTPLTRGDGVQFISVGNATAVGNSITVNVAAIDPGATGNTAVGAAMNLGTAIAGVAANGVITTPITGGAPVETDEALRSRILIAFANPPQGGSYADYIEWALSVAGVTRVWITPEGAGPGSVLVYFMMDVAEAAFGGFPQGSAGLATQEPRAGSRATGDQLTVANYILPRQPVTAKVYPAAPSNNVVNFTIQGWSGFSGATQAAVTAAINAVFLAQASPGGVYVYEGSAGVVDLSYIESAIAAIAGTAGFVITDITCAHGSVTPGPTGNITSNTGYLSTLGAITEA